MKVKLALVPDPGGLGGLDFPQTNLLNTYGEKPCLATAVVMDAATAAGLLIAAKSAVKGQTRWVCFWRATSSAAGVGAARSRRSSR